MTANRRNERPRPFGPDELDGVPGINPEELAAETRLARDIEAVAARGGAAPSAGFADRVMGAIATEPVPAPVIAAGSALRHREVAGFLRSLRDSFRVAFGGGFPVAVRAQAFALVLLVAVCRGRVRVSPAPGPWVSLTTTARRLPRRRSRARPRRRSRRRPSRPRRPPPTFELPTPSPDGELEPAVSASPETPEPGETQEPGETERQGIGGQRLRRGRPRPPPRPRPSRPRSRRTTTRTRRRRLVRAAALLRARRITTSALRRLAGPRPRSQAHRARLRRMIVIVGSPAWRPSEPAGPAGLACAIAVAAAAAPARRWRSSAGSATTRPAMPS